MKPENLEFIGLWEASGWTKAETSRRLELDRSAIGKFITGQISPSAQTLKLFKLILASEAPGALTGAVHMHDGELEQSEWERKLFAELRGLHAEDRDRVLNAVKAFVVGLPKRPPEKYQRSSKPHTEAQQIAHRAGEQFDASSARSRTPHSGERPIPMPTVLKNWGKP